jgi:hypothetical protein
MKFSEDEKIRQALDKRDDIIRRANLNYLKRVARIRGLNWDKRTIFMTGANSLSTRAKGALNTASSQQWSTRTLWTDGTGRSFLLKHDGQFASPDQHEESEYVYIDVLLASTIQRPRLKVQENCGNKTLHEIEEWLDFWGLELRP